MKISTKGRYALEAVLDIAVNAGVGGPVNIKGIAARNGISENYLEQLFVILRRKGIVESTRGALGGYRLAKPSGDISAGEVIRAVEGTLSPVACADERAGRKTCGRYEDCATRLLWKRMTDAMNGAADSVSIAELAECHDRMNLYEVIEYFI